MSTIMMERFLRNAAMTAFGIGCDYTAGLRHCTGVAGAQAIVLGRHCEASQGRAVMPEVFVAKIADLPEGERKIVQHGAHDIGVFHWEGQFYAYANMCLHQGGPACEGMVTQNVVDVIDKDGLYQGQTYGDETHFVCPWHGYEYDLKTGECIGDRKLKLRKYDIVKRGEDIYVVA
jgi:nitrite reductase/ring-hydroxylating ferredoxin subunit